MRSLWEATNGYTGESYVRCYVYADSEDDAHALATREFELRRQIKGGSSPMEIQLTLLMTAESQPFVTKASDCGWER